MSRRLLVLLAMATAWTAALAVPAEGQQDKPPPKAFVLVDADSGAVLAAGNAHEPLPPASTTKLMTALVAVEKLPRGAVFEVGDRPAAQLAMRIGMQAGQSWNLTDALHSLIMVSANDAAYALAEAASGSLKRFAADMNDAAIRYGMQDSSFNDPAGFDDSSAYNGGSLVSTYDLAIAARNFLAVPELAAISVKPEYRFTGPGREHRLLNHNRLLKRYPGAIGLKTGYTRRAGHTLVAAATREGRTMIAVVLNADDPYGAAAGLLDQGFATPPDARGTGERLPAVAVRAFPLRAASAAPGHNALGAPQPSQGGGGRGLLRFLTLAPLGLGITVAALRQRALRRRRQRAERRRRLAETRRQEMARMYDDEDWDLPGPAEVLSL
jgi:serine-type D-Ala-D-Ala carboxypeptidase (penicillin-binding protein 5/6)